MSKPAFNFPLPLEEQQALRDANFILMLEENPVYDELKVHHWSARGLRTTKLKNVRDKYLQLQYLDEFSQFHIVAYFDEGPTLMPHSLKKYQAWKAKQQSLTKAEK